MGICASSACDARSTPAPVRLMTTYLVLLHLCNCRLLRTFSQHSHRSLTFQVSDVFTIMLGSRSSSCSRGGLMPLLLPLITVCAVNGAKRYRRPPRRTPLCLSFITTRRGLQPHSVRREVVAHLKDPILLHYRLPRIRLQMPNVTLATAENNFMSGFQQGSHRQQVLGY